MQFKTSYSGAGFDVVGNTLVKRCRNLYGSGLMQLNHAGHYFNTPKVHCLGEDCIVMDYLKDSVPLPVYLEYCTKEKAIQIVNTIFYYVNMNDRGTQVNIEVGVITSKIDHIITRLHDYNDIALANDLKCAFGTGSIEIIEGEYHGDLTFNNILIDKGKPFLIDFLPGYAPTHWLDVVKLQQEVKLEWSRYHTVILGKNYGSVLGMLKDYVTGYIKKHSILNLMEAMNYLRILPYSGKDSVISTVLRNQIKDILK